MANNNIYKVHYHYERDGKVCSIHFSDNVIAATPTESAIKTVLNNNGKGAPSGSVLVIDQIANGRLDNALS